MLLTENAWEWLHYSYTPELPKAPKRWHLVRFWKRFDCYMECSVGWQHISDMTVSRFPMKQLFKCNDSMIIENRTHMTLKTTFIWHSFYQGLEEVIMWRPYLSVHMSACDLVRTTKLSYFHEIQYRSSYRKLLSKSKFPKNWLSDHLPLLFVVNKFLPPLSTLTGIVWVKFGTKNLNVMLLSNCELRTNQCNESQTSC
jgi:hypothetical protein